MQSRLGYAVSLVIVSHALTMAVSAPARADVFTTFDLSGVFASGSPSVVLTVPLSGTFTVDTTIGLVTTVNLFDGQFGPSTIANQQTQSPQFGSIYVLNVTTSASLVGLVFPVATLVNYAGGNLVGPDYTFQGVHYPGSTYFPNQSPGSGVPLQAGMATAEAVPEPGSMGVLMVGLGGFAVFTWSRSIKGSQDRCVRAANGGERRDRHLRAYRVPFGWRRWLSKFL